jgi:hypothetical protein
MDWVDYHYLCRPATDPLSDAALERAWGHVLAHQAIESTALDPPVWRLLDWVLQREPVLLHGSNSAGIEVFEPRRQTDYEGTPVVAVFACDDAIWPLFFAVVDRERAQVLRNGCLHTAQGPRYFFAVAPEGIAAWRAGCVYVLPRERFSQGSSLREWTATAPVRPLARIRVEPSDFPHLDSVIQFEPGEPEAQFVERLTAARDRTLS